MRNFFILIPLFLLLACTSQEEDPRNWKSIEKDLQAQFITTIDSSVILIPEGHFIFRKSLLMDGKKSITIKGAGADKTILSFIAQEEGAEGMKISNCENIILEDFTIEDSKGDNIKITDVNGIILRRVKSIWTGEPKEENGAYAFYPVLSKNVLIENCIAVGSSDAGIYVGQSDSVIIRNNIVYHNVAGIESENSKWVEIYGNEAYNNTGGILVFDLPGLTQYGHTTRVYKNRVYGNNFRNFAPEGNIVATVPPGTGIMLLATRNIEIFGNEIVNNKTMGIGIASYLLVEAINASEESGTQLDENVQIAKADTEYDPYYNEIYIHNNEIRNKHIFPTLKNDFGLLFLTKFPFDTPDIVIDGITSDNEELSLCIQNNEEVKIANLDAANDFENLNSESLPFDCSLESISPIF